MLKAIRKGPMKTKSLRQTVLIKNIYTSLHSLMLELPLNGILTHQHRNKDYTKDMQNYSTLKWLAKEHCSDAKRTKISCSE